jgi:ribosome-associated toxin RatA of RatAB toxin-antitoxin module
MAGVAVTAVVPGTCADRVFAAVADFAAYPRHTDAVREVVVRPVGGAVGGEVGGAAGGAMESDWEVNFRNGVLAWTERDVVDAGQRRIAFEQTDGDFAVFTGTWLVEPDGDGSTVTFEASFDLGMPSLAPMIDPIAERALVDNIRAILAGLLGPAVTFA